MASIGLTALVSSEEKASFRTAAALATLVSAEGVTRTESVVLVTGTTCAEVTAGHGDADAGRHRRPAAGTQAVAPSDAETEKAVA